MRTAPSYTLIGTLALLLAAWVVAAYGLQETKSALETDPAGSTCWPTRT